MTDRPSETMPVSCVFPGGLSTTVPAPSLSHAAFAFAVYRISDFALLTASVFTIAAPHAASVAVAGHETLVAMCLLLAAAFKSSQFPLTGLFVRSMEGPTPTSALGYAGLSAHVGVVLLASTMPLWFPVDGEETRGCDSYRTAVCIRIAHVVAASIK